MRATGIGTNVAIPEFQASEKPGRTPRFLVARVARSYSSANARRVRSSQPSAVTSTSSSMRMPP